MHSANLDIKKSILNELSDSESDIREIYFDYLRMREGYTFYYIIDADEVFDYCQPFAKDRDKDLGEIADEQFVIKYLFGNQKSKTIILQDYLEEYINIRSFILSTNNQELFKEAFNKYKETLEEFLSGLDRYKNDDENFLREVIKAYSFLLSISEGLYKITLSNLNNLMSEGVMIEGAIKDTEIAESLGSYVADTKLIQKIYDGFEFQSLSKYNDIYAILKTYHLTKSAQKEQSKNIFYLVSSSTKDVTSFKKKIIENEFEQNAFCDGILGKGKASLIRSKSQIFALLIFNTWNQESSISTPLRYTVFKDKIKQYIKKVNQKSGYKELANAFISKRDVSLEIKENLTIFNYLLGRYNNSHTLKVANFKKILSKSYFYKKELQFTLTQIIKKSDELFIEQFGEKRDFAEIYNSVKDYMQVSDFENEVIIEFLGSIRNLKESEELEFDRGEDPIEGVFNAFPVLFEYSFYKDKFFPLLEEIEKDYMLSKDKIEKLAKGAITNDLYMMIMYLLLVVKYKHPKGNYNSNFITYENVIKLIDNKAGLNRKGKLHIKTNYNRHLQDLYAVGCWAARRARCYRFAYELSIKAKRKFPKDPRFNHSLALIGFCWKYEYDTKRQYDWPYLESEGSKKDYFRKEGRNSVLWHCKEAIKKYKAMEVHKNNHFALNNYVALLNLTAFIYVIMYKQLLEKKTTNQDVFYKRKIKHKHLRYSRNIIDEMKILLQVKNEKQELRDYPSYLHTEVFLEYYELRDKTIACRKVDAAIYANKLKAALDDSNFAIVEYINREILVEKFKVIKNKLLGLEIENYL